MADADGKMWIEKCGWKKNADNKKSELAKNLQKEDWIPADGRCIWENEDRKNLDIY